MVSRGLSGAASVLALALGATAFVPTKIANSGVRQSVQSSPVQKIEGCDAVLARMEGKVRGGMHVRLQSIPQRVEHPESHGAIPISGRDVIWRGGGSIISQNNSQPIEENGGSKWPQVPSLRKRTTTTTLSHEQKSRLKRCGGVNSSEHMDTAAPTKLCT